MSAELPLIAELLEQRTGMQIKAAQLPSLAAAIGRMSPALGTEQVLAGLNDPREAPALLARLVDEVAIGETYFMRERGELESIDWGALLAAAHARGDQGVSVWVAACASGEEAYSIAMLATEAFGGGHVPVSILATDISDRALRRAQEGLYSERSMREIDERRRERFFRERRGKSAVGEQLRSLVRFRRHNLVAEPAPPLGEVTFDVVLCRNVLIYFGAADVERVVGSLESALRPGGQLILGAADRLMSSARRFADLAALARRAPDAPADQMRKRRPRSLPRSRSLPAAPAAPAVPSVAASRMSKPARAPAASPAPVVAEAEAAADVGDYERALAITAEILTADPLDAEAYFVRGVAELAAGDPAAASESLRRALYIDPSFSLAAFHLGRAQDLRGDGAAAVRAYRRALRTLDPNDERHRHLLERVNAGDIARACRTRLAAARG
jgi:chemotaxis protein methyltransferase CheR